MNPDKVCEEVSLIGFSAELLEMIENNQEELLRRKQSSASAMSGADLENGNNKDQNQKRTPNVIKSCTLIIEGMTCTNCS